MDLIESEIKKALEKCRKVHGNYDKIVCVVGEPWVMTKTRHITIEKPHSFKLTKKILDEAIARDTRLFEQEALRDYAKNEEWEIIHATQPTVDINGYRITDPIGVLTDNAVIHVTVSLAPAAFVDTVMDAYVDTLHRTDVSFMGTSSLIAQFTKEYAHVSVITLGGISGTFSVWSHDNLEYSETLHRGLADFEAGIAHLFHVNHAHIDSVINFASDQKLIEHERDIYYQRIEKSYAILQNEFRMGLLRLKKHTGSLVRPVFLMANPGWIGILKSLVEKDIESEIIIPDDELFDTNIMYTHGVRVKNVMLSCAILSARER
jgi:hypothetical protein